MPALVAIAVLPSVLYRPFPPGVTDTPDAPGAAREALRSMGPLSRNERITAVFGAMVCAWIMGGVLDLSNTAVAIAGVSSECISMPAGAWVS